jgi:penicillin-binding protein 1C
MIHQNWFVLPPAMEWYYKSKNPSYKTLPPMRSGCTDENPVKNMELIYPHENIIVYVPTNLDGSKSEVVFEAAHRKPSITIFWHLDDTFIGHQTGLNPEEGKHLLTLVDENGETLYKSFEVVKK